LTVVADASVVVASLIDSGPAGVWAEHILETQPLVAPHLMPVEVANILRRASVARTISRDAASMAYSTLTMLPVELIPFAPLADRIWELRSNVTAYDAWYVALAETLDLSLATLDLRLAQAPGTRCAFLLPPA